jgi:rhamnulokinase
VVAAIKEAILRTIESLTKQTIDGVQIIGGGSQNAYLNQDTANAAKLPVAAGPVEATVIGNVLVQSIDGDRFASLAEARRYVARIIASQSFRPTSPLACKQVMQRYAQLEARYT